MIPDRVEPCFGDREEDLAGSAVVVLADGGEALAVGDAELEGCAARLRGSFWRTGAWTTFSTIFSTTSRRRGVRSPAGAGASFLAVDSGWATLQLSR